MKSSLRLLLPPNKTIFSPFFAYHMLLAHIWFYPLMIKHLLSIEFFLGGVPSSEPEAL